MIIALRIGHGNSLNSELVCISFSNTGSASTKEMTVVWTLEKCCFECRLIECRLMRCTSQLLQDGVEWTHAPLV